MRHRRSSWLLLFSATGLIAGWNDVKIVPVFPDFDSLGRNVYPRNVNETHSNSRLRLLSPQYTILVLSGCSRNPTLYNRSANVAHTCRAWRSVTQCTTASSANRSNSTVGNSRPTTNQTRSEGTD